MRRISFRLPADEKEELLDALMPLLPAGVRERPGERGEVELTTIAAGLPSREALETAAGRALDGWDERDVPADWRERRAIFGGGAFLVAGRVLVRSPWDPPAAPGVLDLVLERGGGGFGSGSHSTTRMCLALLLEIEPSGGAADLGCGLGTLAIAAARLGWAPVVAVDRMAAAVAAARENGARNDVEVDWRVADLEAGAVPLATLLLVNAPPPVHARVAAALSGPADQAGRDSSAGVPGDSSAAGAPGDSSAGVPGDSSAAGAPGDSSAAGAPGDSLAVAGDSSAAEAPGNSPAALGRPRHLIVSGVVPAELDAVAGQYSAAGWAVVARREEDGWAAALLEPAGA